MFRKLCNKKETKLFVFLFILFSVLHDSFSQTPVVTGQVNRYIRVTAVGVNNVTVPDVTGFAAGDTAMVMQMSGAIINASATLPGNLQSWVGNPGYYEVLIISAVNGGTGQVTFTRNLTKSYSPLGKVQLIRVRSYRNAVVNTELTCADWDSTTVSGGVLAFLVKGTLTLNANINVSGRGFKGGIVAPGRGDCYTAHDSVRHFFYNRWHTVSGYKGEGLAIRNTGGTAIYPGLARGKGVTLTGGGGGNGHFSGGGGGSNYGAGKEGDVEVPGICTLSPGGNGGYSIASTSLTGGVFMGGGGGASTYGAAPSLSAGGRGGGIVIILADTIEGNGRFITANGAEPPANTVANSGAGGGGGAGSVIISTRYYQTYPILGADGGKGGNTSLNQGAGGGGGGGLVWTKGAFPGTRTVIGGIGGYNNGSPSNLDGSTGAILTTLNLPLNGFLFNEIYSSVNLTQTDSICEGEVPPVMIGTQPTGGNGTYNYQWQRSYNNSLYENVAGTSINYTPTDTETNTVWFRRVVTDGAGMTDISMPVRVIVHPLITGNLVGSDTTLCYNQNPEELYPLNSGPGGGTGIFLYTWEGSSNGIDWESPGGDVSNAAYDPAVLTSTRLFHRIVNSGACTDISSPVTVTILPSITANTVNADHTICQGMTFANLTGSTPSGGASPAYSYLWKSSTDNIIWAPATGTNSGINYDPQNDSPGTYYYKRIVFSGLNNTCQDTSASVHLLSHPAIAGNSISADQTICEGSVPATLTGTNPSGGDGINYPYRWQNSIDGVNFTDIASGGTSRDYNGVMLSADTWYRRIVSSSVCSDTSNDVSVTVNPAITNYLLGLAAGEHDTICTGMVPPQIQGTPGGGTGSFSYSWESSPDNITYTGFPHTGREYQPGALTSTTWYRRTVTSGVCIVQSSFKITVLPLISGNTISGNMSVCNNEPPDTPLTGSAPAGGDGRYRYRWEKFDESSVDWEPATGTGNTISYQLPQLSGTTRYRRVVLSGENNCCVSVSTEVTVAVDTMPLNITAGPDLELLPYQFAVRLQGYFEGTGTCEWSFGRSEGDPKFEDKTDMTTVVRQLGFGENIFVFQVANNTCIAEPDEVSISVPEIHIPEAVSPNNDGLNDYFRIEGLEYTFNELVIINTGGAVVFRQQNYRSDIPANAWYGLDNYGNELPEGTYYYLLTIKGATDISVPGYMAYFSGFLIIRR